ncbi:hypothetical protein Leryth_025515, partial [Lithospermum erythrorhizon]
MELADIDSAAAKAALDVDPEEVAFLSVAGRVAASSLSFSRFRYRIVSLGESFRHLDWEDLYESCLPSAPIDCFYSAMPLFKSFPYLLTDLLNEYFPQAGYSLLDKGEGKGKQSIDIYSSVPSPRGILGTPVLSRLGSSFFGSSLTRRHTPDNLAPLHKPLLPQQVVDDHVSKQDKRSDSSYRSPSRKSSLAAIDSKPKISHELPMSHQSSYGQAVLNGTNVLCGVGLLTTPYAVKEGGWSGIAILFLFAVLSFYTGLLLRSCLDSQPGLETYPDVGQAAFGNVGRFAISV